VSECAHDDDDGEVKHRVVVQRKHCSSPPRLVDDGRLIKRTVEFIKSSDPISGTIQYAHREPAHTFSRSGRCVHPPPTHTGT